MTRTSLRPQRSSLIAETVHVLRESLQSGKWSGQLPGERILCAEWGISRPTLRAAVEALCREGLLEVTQGRRTKILVNGHHKRPGTITIGLLSPDSLQKMPPFVMLWVDELRGLLAAQGHLLQVHVGRAGFKTTNPEHALRAFVHSMPARLWLLYQSTEVMQRWFAQNALSCLVIGSLFPEVKLPAVDRDYRAVCRHAVGLLTGRGHRRLAFLIHEHRLGGDLESEQGYLEGLETSRLKETFGVILHHDDTTHGICEALDRMLAKKVPPTALLVARTNVALTVYSHLTRLGIRIPEDVAIVCRDDDTFLDSIIPRMSRYSINPSDFAKRIFRMVISQVESGHVLKGMKTIMPVFTERESA